MSPARATALLLCFALSVLSLGTSNSAPTPSPTPTLESVGGSGLGETSSLHAEITEALTENNETSLLNRVKRIVTRRSGGSGCQATCTQKTFDELWTQLSSHIRHPLFNGARIRVWSANMNLQSGFSTRVSFGASMETMKILDKDAEHRQCIELNIDEDKNRFPTYLITATRKASCSQTQKYAGCGKSKFATLRLDRSTCDNNKKEKWSVVETRENNCLVQ